MFALIFFVALACIAMIPSNNKHRIDNIKETPPADSDQHYAWKDFGGGPDHSKFVEFTQINHQNVTKLQPAFVYPTADNSSYRFNPIIVDNVMYVLAKNNSLVALDATTGNEIWIHANLRGIIQRGINFWESKDKQQKRFLICLGNSLQAIDATTGKSILTFGDSGSVDLKLGLDRDPALFGRGASTTPGHIYKDLLLLGSAPGAEVEEVHGELGSHRGGRQDPPLRALPFRQDAGRDSFRGENRVAPLHHRPTADQSLLHPEPTL